MNRYVIVLVLALLMAIPLSAQRKRTATKAQKTPEQQLYDELLLSTAKVMFIDSIVVDKDTFLEWLPLPAEAGTLKMVDGAMEYTNEYGDTRLFAEGDSLAARHLYIAHRYSSQWDAPQPLTELDNTAQDYPFLMADGITLYFSAEGEGTVGGRDIFRTIYNSEDLAFYEATNIGLPYNSPANDYLLAISDIDNLGWLVTDRQQEEGKVCIYTFEPTAQRVGFDETVPSSAIADYAAIRSIRDTWAFGDYTAAANRVVALHRRLAMNDDSNAIRFVVNDATVYTSLDDFSSQSNRALYTEIEENKRKATQLDALLASLRTSYEEASPTKRREIGRKIAALEEEVEALYDEVGASEKALRNSENQHKGK